MANPLMVQLRDGSSFTVRVFENSSVPGIVHLAYALLPALIGGAIAIAIFKVWGLWFFVIGLIGSIVLEALSGPGFGVTLPWRSICFIGNMSTTPQGSPHGVIARFEVAHELIHAWQWDRGILQMLWRITKGLPLPWRKRDYEIEALAGENLLLSDTHPAIIRPSWLDNYQNIPRPA